jgi:hypothetical protein
LHWLSLRELILDRVVMLATHKPEIAL